MAFSDTAIRGSRWGAPAALALSLALAWANFLGTGRWGGLPGALHGGKKIPYLAALAIASLLALLHRKRIGRSVDLGPIAARLFLLAGWVLLAGHLLLRFPPHVWPLIPFDDDWTPLFKTAANGVALMRRGVVMGWNWAFLGGCPASTDVAQSFAAHALIPMTLFGDRIGFHVLLACWFLAVPLFVWWDVRQEDPRRGAVAGALACCMTASLSVTLGKSGDVNSLAGVFSAALALFGSRAARLGRWWGGPLLVLGLTAGLYSHVAFFVYAVIFLALEAAFYREPRMATRAGLAVLFAVIAALPVHWESLRYPAYVSFNNVVYAPGAPVDWGMLWRTLYYNVEILAFPQRWFNDYRSLVNVWSPAILLVALLPGSSRGRFYACAALLAHLLLRFNTGEFGAGFDRIMHLLPMLAAPALAEFLLRVGGSRALAASLAAVIALYGAVSFQPVPHVRSVREFNPPLIERLAGLDGNLVLVEVSPHRDMDSDPVLRSPKAPWNVHFEGLLPDLSGQRFYSQMWDGWTWSIWRGQVVGAGTFAGRAISRTSPAAFTAEMNRWGVRHLLVWTDASRSYLAAAGPYVERWRSGVWSHFELIGADVRSVAVPRGSARLTNLDPLGADVEIEGIAAADPVIVRTNYYPAWRATVGGQPVPLHSENGQLAFRAPSSGSYVVRLEYPRRYWLSLLALVALAAGMLALSRPRLFNTGNAGRTNDL